MSTQFCVSLLGCDVQLAGTTETVTAAQGYTNGVYMLTDGDCSLSMLAHASVSDIAWGVKYSRGHLDSVSLVFMDEVWQALG